MVKNIFMFFMLLYSSNSFSETKAVYVSSHWVNVATKNDFNDRISCTLVGGKVKSLTGDAKVVIINDSNVVFTLLFFTQNTVGKKARYRIDDHPAITLEGHLLEGVEGNRLSFTKHIDQEYEKIVDGFMSGKNLAYEIYLENENTKYSSDKVSLENFKDAYQSLTNCSF
jgi:hypothetical protein